MDNIVYPLTDEGIFTVVFKLGPITFKTICEEALLISSVGEGPAPIVNGVPTKTQPKWRRVDAFLRQLRNKSLIEFTRPKGWVATDQVKDPSIIADVLLMNSEVQVPDEAIIAHWSPWERAQVLLWGWASMYAASDNAGVRVPPVPPVLKPFMEHPR